MYRRGIAFIRELLFYYTYTDINQPRRTKMAGVNLPQKVVVAIGAALAALRVVYPVKEKGVGGLRLSMEQGFFQNVDWNTTILHIGGILIVTVAAYIILKKR